MELVILYHITTNNSDLTVEQSAPQTATPAITVTTQPHTGQIIGDLAITVTTQPHTGQINGDPCHHSDHKSSNRSDKRGPWPSQ